MVAVALIHSALAADHYEQMTAADSRIDELRTRMRVAENRRYSLDYLDPQKRSIANSVQIFFTDGTFTERIEVEYPIGHPRRRDQGVALLEAKFVKNIATRLPDRRRETILRAFSDPWRLDAMPVLKFVDLFLPEG